jgi:hypothetical protein
MSTPKEETVEQFMKEVWALNPFLQGCPVLSSTIRKRYLSGAWDEMHLARIAMKLVPKAQPTDAGLGQMLQDMGDLLLHTVSILRANPDPDVQGLVARIEETLYRQDYYTNINRE